MSLFYNNIKNIDLNITGLTTVQPGRTNKAKISNFTKSITNLSFNQIVLHT